MTANQSYLAEMATDDVLRTITAKVLRRERISFNDGIALFERGEPGFLGSLANFVRESKNGNKTFFNRNFHIEPTNICVFSCKFCSYSRTLKNREEGWELTPEQ